MFCPACGDEYVDGMTECPECGGRMVDVLAEKSPGTRHDPEPVCVFADGRAERIALAKSLLTDAGIVFGVAGEEVQDLFGWGRFPAGSNVFMGPVRILVAEEDADVATQLLASLQDSASPGQFADEGVATEPSELDEGQASRLSTWPLARRFATIACSVVLATFLAELILSLASSFSD